MAEKSQSGRKRNPKAVETEASSNGHPETSGAPEAPGAPETPEVDLTVEAAAEVDAELGAAGVSGPDDEALTELELSVAAGPDAAPALDDAALERAVAALLFAANEPLTVGRLGALVDRRVGDARVEAALAACQQRLSTSGLPFELRAIAGGWQLLTSTDQDAVVTRLARVKKDEKVSPASLETLAIIAYRQPVSKAEIEAIRGVQVGPILRALVDRGFVRVAGRAEVPGHPLLYGTTKKFLDTFGLANLEELPRDAELVRD
ncbi:MAG: SMC-Scp complex subunit ScpB [Planctomycetes bacterium]|nr:SMC-Scp complex subunit ScpB [Planctomycetota bacterium]